MDGANGSAVATRIGRVLGTVLSAIWLFILLAGLFAGDDELAVETEEATIQGAVLTALGIMAITGFVLSLRWTRPGGLLTLVAGCLLCVFASVTAGRNHWLAVLVAGVPWVVVSGLMLVGGLRRAGTATEREVGDRPDGV
jgi:hypothetical protein